MQRKKGRKVLALSLAVILATGHVSEIKAEASETDSPSESNVFLTEEPEGENLCGESIFDTECNTAIESDATDSDSFNEDQDVFLANGLTAYPSGATTRAEISRRLEELNSVLPGNVGNYTYFTVNGKACTHGAFSSCSNCSFKNVMRNRLGMTSLGGSDAYTCAGFSKFVYEYVFRKAYYEGSGRNLYCAADINMNNYANVVQHLNSVALPGDHLSFFNKSGQFCHAAVYVKSKNNNEFIIYEANQAVENPGVSSIHYGERSNSQLKAWYSRVTIWRDKDIGSSLEEGTPVVRLKNIKSNETYSGSIDLWAQVSAHTGGNTAMFYVDAISASNKLSPDGNGNITCRLDTTKYSNGSHEIKVVYWYSGNKTVNDRCNVNIRNEVKAPTIKKEGLKVTITGGSGDTIYYCIDGKQPYSVYKQPIEFTTVGNHSVNAYCQNSSKVKSDTVSESIDVSYAPLPTITKEETPSATIVSMNKAKSASKVYYSVNDSAYKEYTSKFTVTTTSTIKYYATLSGYINSKVAKYNIVMSAPNAPTAQLKNTSTKIPVGDVIMIQSSKTERTAEYICSVKKNGELALSVQGADNNISFSLDEAGSYEATVVSKNSFGLSEASNVVKFEVMPNVTVSFVDWDGTILREPYTIKYGGSVEPPMAPPREGYDFQGWQGKYENVTADTVVTPKYEIKKYNVTFKNTDGAVVLTQRVNWGEAAQAPDMTSYIPAAGYAFAGWCVDQNCDCKDMTCVKGNMTLTASYAWENSNFTVAINNLSVVYDVNDQNQPYYTATMNLVCNPNKNTSGRVILQLKTAQGTLVGTHFGDVNLVKGNSTTPLTINLQSKDVASKATVYAVELTDDDKTSGTIAAPVDANVTRRVNYEDWSEWSTTKPTADDIEQKTQYRYNTREITTRDNTKTLSGYTLISTTPKTGSWSSWSDTAVSAVDNVSLKREVNTRTVVDKTYYTYYHYCTGAVNGAKYWTDITNQTSNAVFNAHCTYHAFEGVLENDSTFVYQGVETTPHVDKWYRFVNGERVRCSNTCYTWYRSGPSYTYKKQYQYRDTKYTYTFEKVSSYKSWQDTAPKEGTYYQKQTRTVYRGRNKVQTGSITEKNTTTPISLNGRLEGAGNLSGLVATAFVYKKENVDPTESQIEHMEKVVIGADNSYSLNVVPKEDPSAETGDFVIAFAVEGATGLINAGIIPAPKPIYTVQYMANGISVASSEVSAGGSVNAPNAPAVEGKRFVKWDTNAVNVKEDLVIEAVYEDSEYAIVYVDNLNGTIEIERAAYNDPIDKELPVAPEGYEFTGWDAEVVTGDMVVKAVSAKKKYTVKFMDATGENVVDEKVVACGGSVTPPAYEYMVAGEGQRITGWSTEKAWWDVQEDMCVYPVVEYETTTATPYTNLANMKLTRAVNLDDELCPHYPVVELKTDTEGATIYYSVDYKLSSYDVSDVDNEQTFSEGEDTIDEEMDDTQEMYEIYDRPIEIYQDVTITAIAVADGKNASDVARFDISYEETTEDINPENEENPPETSDEPADTTHSEVTASDSAIIGGELTTVNVSIKYLNTIEYTGKAIDPTKALELKLDLSALENAAKLAMTGSKDPTKLFKKTWIKKNNKNAGTAEFYLKIKLDTKKAKSWGISGKDLDSLKFFVTSFNYDFKSKPAKFEITPVDIEKNYVSSKTYRTKSDKMKLKWIKVKIGGKTKKLNKKYYKVTKSTTEADSIIVKGKGKNFTGEKVLKVE